MQLNFPVYSYRNDPTVPAFNDAGARTVMDAQCALCARGARWISHNDTANEFRIIPVQSDLGAALLRHYGMDPDDPVSWLYLIDGEAYTSLDAVIRVGQRLGGIMRALVVFRVLPRVVQDVIYGFVARNRFAFGGRTDLCGLPDKEIQSRLMR